jgi:hypothetical protein
LARRTVDRRLILCIPVNNGLYSREPLYRMAAPAQAVAGYDITPIASWLESGEWIGRIDQELLGFRRDLHHQFLLGSFAVRAVRIEHASRIAGMPTSPPGVMSAHTTSDSELSIYRSILLACRCCWLLASLYWYNLPGISTPGPTRRCSSSPLTGSG